ncbi:hypothetical protein NW762_006077 [Fusarium torreyae]|uniref:Mitochondrial pyruvate carrier n=1 Tax=Fusarium torreyae TaxID=1237075 RepID=A0A9W8S4R3_9HYPO|nr:hypothetical protein NW762_006077 [Fusarium torreyae]
MASPANTLFRASRPLFRQATLAVPARQAFRSQGQQAFRQNFYQGGRRWQSTDGAQQQQQGWFKRMWESEIGFKTVHFWAPVMKWALVLAGISDFARPAEKLSFTQNLALTCTGIIWTRWCLIIKPKNYLLAAVNFFLGLVGLVQITRIARYESAKKQGLQGAIEDIKADAKETINEVKP